MTSTLAQKILMIGRWGNEETEMKLVEFDQGDGEYRPILLNMDNVVFISPVTITGKTGDILGARIHLEGGSEHIVHNDMCDIGRRMRDRIKA